ncbi:hypothetical protein [Paenibacillus sp. Y412MC10]|uniref:hypothetical protein n=1 Tax=Geobacillus sp. (strain Y412MC10) TaxID=481743 RepID=UPI0001789631|nr:hypothetical protein [Paenibacillus sp. Y412MC10]ACX63376.1 hypothetical protein GYMC10_1084 [Paenibacillus sp. Y412MC10]
MLKKIKVSIVLLSLVSAFTFVSSSFASSSLDYSSSEPSPLILDSDLPVSTPTEPNSEDPTLTEPSSDQIDENKAALAANGSWNLYGTPTPSCNCMYVTSQGDITLEPTRQTVRFSGYASTVWSGGYSGDVTMKIWAKTLVTYVNSSSTSSTPHESTQTKNGSNQTLVSVNISDTYSSYYLWTASVQTSGWVDFDGKYFQATGVGNSGI